MGGVAASEDVFRAVADPTRRALLELLSQAEHTAGDLARPFRMSQPAISQHLRILRQARLVRSRRIGRLRLYRLNPKPLQTLHAWASQFKVFADPSGRVWAFAKAAETHVAAEPQEGPPAHSRK
jgi:DNA-binding transcriptional ArsR family regulator